MNIIITGGSKGFGKAIASRFAADGKAHRIFISARDQATLDKTASEISTQYPAAEVLTFSADFAIQSEVEGFGNWILGQCTDIDILVNNAGIYLPGSVHNEPAGTLEKLMAVNLYSAYHLTRLLLPAMMNRKQGHIFNMCSIASLQAYANGGAYSISKFALAGFSKNLREELKQHGIKVTTIYPGAAYTDSWKGSGVDPQRLMDENDIAELIYAAAVLSARACTEEIIVRPQLGDL